jgi:hypothetical protein
MQGMSIKASVTSVVGRRCCTPCGYGRPLEELLNVLVLELKMQVPKPPHRTQETVFGESPPECEQRRTSLPPSQPHRPNPRSWYDQSFQHCCNCHLPEPCCFPCQNTTAACPQPQQDSSDPRHSPPANTTAAPLIFLHVSPAYFAHCITSG